MVTIVSPEELILKMRDIPCILLEPIRDLLEEACDVQGVLKRDLKKKICKRLSHVECPEVSSLNIETSIEFFVPRHGGVQVDCECGERANSYVNRIVMESDRFRVLKSEEALGTFKKILKETFGFGDENFSTSRSYVRKLKRKVSRKDLKFTSFVFPLQGNVLVAYDNLSSITEMVDLMITLRAGYMIPPPRHGTYYPVGVVSYAAKLCSVHTLLDDVKRGKLVNSRMDVWEKRNIRLCLECMLRKRFNIIYDDILTIDSRFKGFKKLVFYLYSKFMRVAHPDAWERQSI